MTRFLTLWLLALTVCLSAGCGAASGGAAVSSAASGSPSGVSSSAASSAQSGGASPSAAPVPDENTVILYTPHDADPMNAVITAFMERYPTLRVEVIAGGTGELLDRVAAEAEQPQADVFWGGGADSMETCKQYFESYTSAGASAIGSQFQDPDHRWIGESPLPMVILYNKKLLQEAGVPAPTSWADCLRPEFKGKIAYCWPSKSGSAYTQLCTMILANGGGEQGWNYVARFAANLDGKILDSSGMCHKLVASGEDIIGVTIEKSAAAYQDNPNVGFCYPSEGTSAVPDAVAIIRGCPHEKNAKIFVDFVTSRICQSEQSQNWSRRPSRLDTAPPAGLPALDRISLVSYDFAWAAAQKQANLARFNALMKIQP